MNPLADGAGTRVILNDGSSVCIRPLRPDDRDREQTFIRKLSPGSRRYRFLGEMREASDALLDSLMTTDGTNNVAFIAIVDEKGAPREVGVCRYAATDRPHECECAVTVADDWRQRGLAVALMRELIATARRAHFQNMFSVDLAANHDMEVLARYLGFERHLDPQDPTLAMHRLTL